ncbi:hypothetical protein, partial, partial [Absidia glauca]
TPLGQNRPIFTLKSLLKDAKYQRLDYLEHSDTNLDGLQQQVETFMKKLIRQTGWDQSSSDHISPRPLNIKAFRHLDLTETNEDGTINKSIMRTGVFYSNKCEDHVKTMDVTETQLESDDYLVYYAKVICFFEVVYDNRKKYRLCALQRYDTIDTPHPTGYQTLVSSSLAVCCVEHILEKVYVVPDFGDESGKRFLLNVVSGIIEDG